MENSNDLKSQYASGSKQNQIYLSKFLGKGAPFGTATQPAADLKINVQAYYNQKKQLNIEKK